MRPLSEFEAVKGFCGAGVIFDRYCDSQWLVGDMFTRLHRIFCRSLLLDHFQIPHRLSASTGRYATAFIKANTLRDNWTKNASSLAQNGYRKKDKASLLLRALICLR